MAFDWLTGQVLREPRQFCVSTDCCHYQSLLSGVIKFKIKGILHVCVILHKAYLLIDQLLYYTSPTPSHCMEKPRVRMGTHWGWPWLPAGNIVLPSDSIWEYWVTSSCQLGTSHLPPCPAKHIALSSGFCQDRNPVVFPLFLFMTWVLRTQLLWLCWPTVTVLASY